MGFAERLAERRKQRQEGGVTAAPEQRVITPADAAALAQYGITVQPTAPNTEAAPMATSQPTGDTPLAEQAVGYGQRAWEGAKREYAIANKNMRRSDLGYKMLTGTATPEDKNELDQLSFQIENESKLNEGAPMIGTAPASIVPQIGRSMREGARGALFGGSMGAAAGAVTGPGAAAGAGIGAGVGGTVQALGDMRKQEAGQAYLALRDAGIHDDIAKPIAHAYGLGSMILEDKALKLLAHMVPGGDKLAKGVMKSVISKVVEKTANPASKAALRMAGVSAGEATVESTQQLLQNTLQEIAAQVDNLKYESGLGAKSLNQLKTVLSEGVAETFAQTALGFGITAIPGTSINLLIDTKAGRAAAKAAKEEAPDTPVEVTIKKKAQAKRLRERAAEQNEQRKLAEKKKQDAKVKKAEPAPKPVPPPKLPVQPVAPAAPAAPVAPTGTPDLGAIQAQGAVPTGPAPTMPKVAGVAPTGTPDLGALQAGQEAGPAPQSPDFSHITDKYGTEIKTAPGFDLITDLSKHDMKGVQQKKLIQPILILNDGTVVKGPQLSEPWSISKNKVALEELPDSFSEARKEAMTRGLDLKGAKTGFLVDGKPLESAVIKEKFDIGNQERMARGEMAIDQQAQKEEANAIEGLKKEREKWAEKVRNSREPSSVDMQAARKLRSAALKAAKKVRNTSLGKHFDVSDLQSAAQEAMWMVMLNDSPAQVEGFMKGERGYYNRMVTAVQNHLLNWQKDQLGPRRQVADKLKKGTLKTDLPYQEWTQATGQEEGPVSPAVPLYPDSEQNAIENRTVQQSSGVKANPHNVGVKLQDTLPSKVIRIDPKTGERTEVSIGQMRGELLKRRAEIAKEAAAKKKHYEEMKAKPVSETAKRKAKTEATKAATEVEKVKAQLAQLPAKTKPIMPSTDLGKIAAEGVSAKPKRVKKTASEKLAKKAKPLPKEKKRAEGKDYKMEVDTRTMESKTWDKLHDNGGTRAPKNNMGYANTTGARLAATKLNKTDGEGTWEVYPHPYSPGNYTIVNQKLLDSSRFDKLKTNSDQFKEAVIGKDKPKPVETTAILQDNKVPNAGSIFDQTRKMADKIDEAIAEDYAAKDAKVASNTPNLGDLMTEKAQKSNPVNVADKFKKHLKDAGTGPVDLGALMNNKGSSGMLQDVLNIVYDSTSKVAKGFTDWIDVQAKWDRIKAHQTGLRLKNYHGAVEAVEKAELKRLKQFTDVVRTNDKDISQEDLAKTVLAAEDPAKFERLSEKHKAIAKWIRNYFDTSEQEYLDRNIEISFQTRKMMDLIRTVEETKSWDARNKALHDMNTLDRLEFVHIPLKVLKKSVEKTKGKEFQAKFGKKVRALQNLAAKKRRALSLNDLVNKKIVPLESIDVYRLLGNYMKNKANDMAVADIRDAAMQEGFIKAQKSRPKADASGSWKKVPNNFRGLGMFGNDNVWIHDSIINALTDTLESYEYTNKIGKVYQKGMNLIKMAQFYNPVFLPAYDTIQHLMLSGVTQAPKLPFSVARGFKDVFSNSDSYLEALSEGLGSTPFGVPFDQYMEDVDAISKGPVSLGGHLLSTLNKAKGFTKNYPLPVLSLAYKMSWKLAWKMDHAVRMASYNYLREKEGMDASDAAQMAAKFHGDYASVPLKTRRMLNSFFFTPTFKISMMKLYGSLVKNSLKALAGKAETGLEKKMAWGAVTTLAFLLAQEYAMRTIGGFDDDKFGTKYKKRKFMSGGAKEWVISIATPANVPHRLLSKVVAPWTDPASTNAPETWVQNFKWELHPAYRLWIDLVTNSGPNGAPIFGSQDDGAVKMYKAALYVAKAVAPVMKLLGADSGFTTPEGKKLLQKELGAVLGIVASQFVTSYTRQPGTRRNAYKINKLKNTMKYEIKSAMRRGEKPPIQTWIKNLEKRLDKILKEK